MKFSLKTLLLILAMVYVGSLNSYSQTTAQYKLGIAYASSLYSNKEKFEFSIGGEKVTLDFAHPAVIFNKRYAAGERYLITQLSGPRTCNLYSVSSGTFGSGDVLVPADCGTPPLTIFKLQVTGISAGESFKFADNYRRSSHFTFSATINLGGYPQGDDYTVTQTDGPRPCRMSLNQGIVPAIPVTVRVDCGKNTTEPTTTASSTFNKFDLVSRNADNKVIGSFFETFTPVVGGMGADEGRYGAFVTYAKGLGGGSGKYRQIIWRDRKTGETRLVSRGVNGAEGNQNSHAPAISADGRSVAFESYATNLVPVDSNGVRDVFVWNADNGRVTAVSENQGTEADADAYEPAISADGSLIAFTSNADNLAEGMTGTFRPNVFLRDMQSGTVMLISKEEKTGKAGGGSRPSISEDGTRIAFQNYFPLTKEDQNNLWDIYLWQNGSPKLKRVSKTFAGGDKDQGEESSSRVVSPSISGNGKFVAFATTSTNMVADDTNKLQDVFVVEVDTGRVTRASVGSDNAQANGDSPVGQGEMIGISYDGSLVVFSTKARNLGGNVLIKNILTGQIKKVSPDVESTVGQPAMSRTGRFVIFGSNRELDKRFRSTGIFLAQVEP